MIIFNTKYCLTQGITKHEVDEPRDDIVVIKATVDVFRYLLYKEGRDWHRDRESAVLRAEEVWAKRLKSLSKQAKKITALDF